MRLYKTQYSFRISGNRGYDSNRVRFAIFCVSFQAIFSLVLVEKSKFKCWYLMLHFIDLCQIKHLLSIY